MVARSILTTPFPQSRAGPQIPNSLQTWPSGCSRACFEPLFIKEMRHNNRALWAPGCLCAAGWRASASGQPAGLKPRQPKGGVLLGQLLQPPGLGGGQGGPGGQGKLQPAALAFGLPNTARAAFKNDPWGFATVRHQPLEGFVLHQQGRGPACRDRVVRAQQKQAPPPPAQRRRSGPRPAASGFCRRCAPAPILPERRPKAAGSARGNSPARRPGSAGEAGAVTVQEFAHQQIAGVRGRLRLVPHPAAEGGKVGLAPPARQTPPAPQTNRGAEETKPQRPPRFAGRGCRTWRGVPERPLFGRQVLFHRAASTRSSSSLLFTVWPFRNAAAF